MKLPFLRSLLVVALVSIAFPAAALDSNKWRLQCSGGADSDGVITLRITPKDGTPTDVAVAIKDNTGENGVARAIRDAIKAQVGDRYKAETDDGEDVCWSRSAGASRTTKSPWPAIRSRACASPSIANNRGLSLISSQNFKNRTASFSVVRLLFLLHLSYQNTL